MESDFQRSVSLRPNRRADRSNLNPHSREAEGAPFSPEKLQVYPVKMLCRMGIIRLVLVVGIVWMLLILSALLFHVWSCQSSLAFLSAICNRQSKVFLMLDTMGLVPKPQH
ncbi:hypothetical protein CRG98_000896, partial [Punica granatum]